MQERVFLPNKQINDDLLKGSFETPWWYLAWMGLFAALTLWGVFAFGYAINKGLGVTGLNRPIMWGFFLTDFIFWVGISHAGVMLSAILRLAKAEWRRPATRAAELLTVLSLMVSALHPIFHLGRPWRFYWPFPYDFSRGIWPDVRSPLVWDPHAIFTYLIGSTLFVIIALIPDIAVLRDKTKGVAKVFYGALAMGWRGTPRQWKIQIVAGFLLSGLLLPVFVSVHSIVAWDFAVNIGTEGWHVTIFAPYFVIGAVHSGVSGVVTMLILLKWMFKWDDYIRQEHLESLAKLLIVIATVWFYFFFLEFIFALYNLEDQEIALRELQAFTWPYNLIAFVFLFFGYLIPVPLWLFRRVRRNWVAMFITSIMVNIGMWCERFLIIVPGLARKTNFNFSWGSYTPSWVEISIVVACFSLIFLLIMSFAKVFPLIPLFDIKEGQTLSDDIQIGKRTVPALRVEE
ncbi:MAG: molybdopterin oxidoreductase [SAR202 cluster bacterium]|nr:molybdopterin oxidoreductase [SAR202 cluster bacterium]|tara:strand:+ start:2223 stop:3596 length:1374 start_codon:yes stop_codon:yes gene_type:complete